MNPPAIEVPTCACVIVARQLSSIFRIDNKYETEGSCTSAGVGSGFGYLIVRCGYCGSILKTVEGFAFHE